MKRIQTVSTTVNVDVDIDEAFLEENGYHHEDDCPAEETPAGTDRQRLSDWHDRAHGLTLWAACCYEPCTVLTQEFRSTP